MQRILTSFALIFLLAACQETLTAEVTRFNTLSSQLQGKSFAILPDKDQADNSQFRLVSRLVAQALQSYGLRVQGQPLAPGQPLAADLDLVAQIHYGDADSPAAGTDKPDPPPYGWPEWYSPPPSVWDDSDQGLETTTPLYRRYLAVDIFDAKAWRQGKRHWLFEGRAVSQSAIASIDEVMPYLVRALFKSFPGSNGQTISVTIPINKKGAE